MLFTIPRISDANKTKTIELSVVGTQIVVSGDYEATRSLRAVQDRLNEMALGKHLCEPFLSFQEGGANPKILHIKWGEIVFSESVRQPNGYMSTKTYIQQNDFSLAAAREFFGAKKLTPFLLEFAERRLEAALRQRLRQVAGGVYIDTATAPPAVRWKHRSYPCKNMRFGTGVTVAPDSEWSESVVRVRSLGGWEGAIRFCSYLLSLEPRDRPHNQMLTYGPKLHQNWDLMGKDLRFLSECLTLADSLEV